MYEEYFGLERPPFKITPDTSLFFEGGKRGDILAALVYAIHRGEGIIKVVGEVGSGKTMLCRMLQLKLPDTIEIVYIANPSVSPEDILFVIAHELSLPVTRDASKHEVMHQLHDYLLQRHMEDRQVVLFVEEAQGMPLDTLEEIRLLSNLETDQNKLLQIILFGQPELDENLAKKSIRQLRERITHNFVLDPLTPEEIHKYLNFRMRQVGYTGPELISKSVAKKIEQHSAGLLRRINIIADKLLLSAFAEGTHNLATKHVTAAVNDSNFDDQVRTKTGTWSWLTVVVVVALALGLYQTQPLWLSSAAPDTSREHRLAAETGSPVTAMNPSPEVPAPAVETSPPENETVTPRSSVESEQVARVAVAAEVMGSGKIVSYQPREMDAEEKAAIEVDEPDSKPADVAASRETPPVDAGQLLAPVEQLPMQIQTKPQGETRMTESDARLAAASEPSIVPLPETEQPEPVEQSELAVSLAGESPRADTEIERSEAEPDSLNDDEWLSSKLRESKEWLQQAPEDSVSIQVMMRNKSAKRELIEYLRGDWPLDLSKTYLYEVNLQNQRIYRVFYNEFNTMTLGRHHIEQLPDSLKVNSPYLDSVYRMRKALL